LSEVEAESLHGHMSLFEIAAVKFKLGDVDGGFSLLEKAYESHDRYVYLMAITPELKEVRMDPRYLAMMERIGLAGRVRD
ncbi:MAG TPA: hypothetical protein VKF39_03840, partial [Nitrososphaerales archaeon]|nr:hypothetical protein [Nitrososphaerales archaeon]